MKTREMDLESHKASTSFWNFLLQLVNKTDLSVDQFEASTFLSPSNSTGICATRGGGFEPRLGEVANLNQPNTLVLILIMAEFQGKESAFVSKWLIRNAHILE